MSDTVDPALHHLNVEPYFMGFSQNRYIKRNPRPRLFVEAKGAYYTNIDGKKVFDAFSGLWCCVAGHCHPKIVEAVQRQAAKLDYAPAFGFACPETFRLADRVAELAPGDLDYVFFTDSGSEAVDTALKLALAYHRTRGEGHRVRFIGRERGYHGMGFGGISIGGMQPNRKMYPSAQLVGVDHLPHTHSLKDMAFSRGEPRWGTHLADELERLVALHDASTIAAVIVEPMQGSTGVIVPPLGYLMRLREICDRHGLLLIFDEVITGFGRLGANFAANRYGVVPDMLTFAKGVTNGFIPMGGVVVRKGIYDAFMTGPDYAVELHHGYTYSGHPMAAACGLATLDVYREEDLFRRARELEPVLEEAIHTLKGEPNVIDVRNIGLAAAVELAPIPDQPGLRGLRVFEHALANGVYVRWSGEILPIAPPYISTREEVERAVETLRQAIRSAP
jgi:beta-alanine--pyruvate transaminase